MAVSKRRSVRIEKKSSSGATRHPIKAAKLLYSVPKFILRGPIYLIFLITISFFIYSTWAKKDELVFAPFILDKSTVTIESIGGGQVMDVLAVSNIYINSSTLLVTVQEKVRAITETEQETIDSSIYQLKKERDKIIDEATYNVSQLRLQLDDTKQNRGSKTIVLEGKIAQVKEKIKTTTREKTLREKEYQRSLARFERAKKRFNSHDIIISQYESVEQEMDRRHKAVSDAQANFSELNVTLHTITKELEAVSDLHSLDRIKKNIRQQENRRDREVTRISNSIASLENKKLTSQRLIDGVSYSGTVTKYTSIYDGLIKDVHVKKGQMITPGSPLVTLVRDTALLEGNAQILNKDIGKIKIGQSVQIKYLAYPYQEYGIPTGAVKTISKSPLNSVGQDSKYEIIIALEKDYISPIGSKRKHQLELGIEGIVEIKTGEKRFIELLFTPISKFFTQDEA